jgi:hypothetical protein
MAVLGCYNNDALDGVQRGLHSPHICLHSPHIGMVHADLTKMPFVDNTFDVVYAIDAPCHAPDLINISKFSHLHCLY